MTETTGHALRLLDREAPSGYLAEWTAHVAAETKEAQKGTKSAIIFRLDKEWLALSADLMQEVADQFTVRSLPGVRSSIVRGLVNIRGELLLCIALEVVLGMGSPRPRVSSDRLLIFARERFAVPVSEIVGLHRYHTSELRPAPAVVRRRPPVPSPPVCCLGGEKTVACLDETLLLYALNKGLQ